MERKSQTPGSKSDETGCSEIGKDERDPAPIDGIEGKNFIGEAFSTWKAWRGIDDEGSLEHRSIEEDQTGQSGEKSLENEDQDTHRMDAISERNFVSDTFTSYIRPEVISKSWEMENAQPLMSSGQSRTHTLPRTRSLPEIRIPDDYETIVDDKLETNSLQDNVITFLSADQLHGDSLKGNCIDGKDLVNTQHGRDSVGASFLGEFPAIPNGHGYVGTGKSAAEVRLTNSGTAYAFAVHDASMGQDLTSDAAGIACSPHGKTN